MEIYQPSSEATSVGGSSLKPIWGLLILFVLVGTVYYGFQVRFILYFSGSVEFGGAAMTDDAALALYETFTIALYIAAGFGGLASDLLGKRKMVAMAGLVIMAAGLAFIPALGQQPGTAVVMTAVGYGLFQITLLIMLIEHFTGKAYKLDGLMVFYYFLFAFNSTFGALLGAAVFQGGSQSLGFYWLSGLIVLALFWLLFVVRADKPIAAAPIQLPANKAWRVVRLVWLCYLVVLLAELLLEPTLDGFVGSIDVWGTNVPGEVIYSFIEFLLGGVLATLWFKFDMDPWKKLTVSLMCFGLVWLCGAVLSTTDGQPHQLIAVSQLSVVVGSVIFFAMTGAMIARYGVRKWLGTGLGVFSLLQILSAQYLSGTYEASPSWFIAGAAGLLLMTAIVWFVGRRVDG